MKKINKILLTFTIFFIFFSTSLANFVEDLDFDIQEDIPSSYPQAHILEDIPTNYGSYPNILEDIPTQRQNSYSKDCYYCNPHEPSSWRYNSGNSWLEYDYWSIGYSNTYYNTPSYYVPSYGASTYFTTPAYSSNVNYTVPTYTTPTYTSPSFTNTITTGTGINNSNTINPTSINYYPNDSVNVGKSYVNKNYQNKNEGTTWAKDVTWEKDPTYTVPSYKNSFNTNSAVSKEWLMKNGKHTPLTRVALNSGAGSMTMQGACIDGCAPGVGGYFEWGVNKNYLAARTDVVSAGGDMSNYFSQKITGLKAGATYYYRAVIQDRNGNKRYGQIMSYTIPFVKNTGTKVTTTSPNLSLAGEGQNIKTPSNVYKSGQPVITQNGGNTIIVMPDGRVITIDANGKTTVSGGSGVIPTCGCADDLVNQNNITTGNIQNTNTTNIKTATSTESIWAKIKGLFSGNTSEGQNIKTPTQNVVNNAVTSTEKASYSWYEWLILFILLFVFIGALRYLWKAFGGSSSAMH
jgi:hypothetical protein